MGGVPWHMQTAYLTPAAREAVAAGEAAMRRVLTDDEAAAKGVPGGGKKATGFEVSKQELVCLAMSRP